MPLNIEMLDMLKILGGFLSFFFMLLIGGGRILLAQFEKRLDSRFETLEEAIKKGNQDVLRLERELVQHQLEVANNYIRRDDFVRVQATIETKIDGLAIKIENAMLKRKGDVDD